MASKAVVEVRIESKDPSVVQSLESSLKAVSVEKEAPHRDLLTIMKVISESVSMISALIGLWKQWKSLQSPPPVKIEAKSGAQLDLSTVKSEGDIRDFVTKNAGG